MIDLFLEEAIQNKAFTFVNWVGFAFYGNVSGRHMYQCAAKICFIQENRWCIKLKIICGALMFYVCCAVLIVIT